MPQFKAGYDQITILYRDRIRVYFKNLDQAEQAGYDEFDPDQFSKNRQGYVYAFTGLRGDAKGLY
jgi:exonuclease I